MRSAVATRLGGLDLSSMRGWLAIGIVLLLAVPAGASAERHGYWKNCGSPVSGLKITVRTHGVGCVRAQRVLHKFWRAGEDPDPVPPKPGVEPLPVENFICESRAGGSRPLECRNGTQRIRGPAPLVTVIP